MAGTGLDPVSGTLAMAAKVGQIPAIFKSIFGGIQALKGNKQMNNLLANRPQYNISQGYQDAFKTYQSLANSNLPGYDIMKGQIDQSGARTMQNLERGAMGSNQLMSGALQSQDKELAAIKNLGIMSADWRGKQQQNLAGAQNQMGQAQDNQWDVNVLQPYSANLQMASENKKQGLNNFFGGTQDMASSAMNYAGTNAYMKAIQGTYPQQGGQSQQGVTPSYNFNNLFDINKTLGSR